MQTVYDRIGGAPTVRRLVESFYPRVQQHPKLKPIFPEDLTETMENQYLFLTQFFGGPPLYSEKKGHPRLRARHLPFPIDRQAAEAWLGCMDEALDEVGIESEIREMIWSRFVMTAYHMVNKDEE